MAQTINEVMSPDPISLPASASLVDAALAMRGSDIGDVIVTIDGQPRGIVTDRDIVMRAIAEGMDPSRTTLGDICTQEIACLTSRHSVQDAATLMRELAIRRLPIVDENDQLVGVVSLGDLAIEADPGSALGDISSKPPQR